MPKNLQLTPEEVEDLRQEMQAAGEWIRQEIKRRHASKEKRAKAYELRAEGMTQQAISKELGVNQSTVGRWLKR